MDINELKKLAGINEDADSEQWAALVADAMTRFVMGDPQRAIQQLTDLAQGKGHPGFEPGKDYNQSFDYLASQLRKAISSVQ